jgi:hypothetical protein
MFTVLLPLVVNPIAVTKYININTSKYNPKYMATSPRRLESPSVLLQE